MWRIVPYDLPLAVPYRWAHGTQTRRRGVLVTDGTGWGECAPPPHDVLPDLAQQAARHEAAWDEAPDRIRCGYATAALDTEAQAAGKPLAALLGAPRDSVEVNALLTEDLDVIAQAAETAWSAGHRTFKIKLDGRDDEARVAAVRDACPGATLRLDPNGCWRDPVASMAALAPYDIQYVEDPGTGPVEGDIPAAADASVGDLDELEELLAAPWCDWVIVKPQRFGGPDRAATAVQRCMEEGIGVTVTNSLESSIGLHAALHVAALAPDHAHGLGTARFFAKDVAPPPAIDDGRMALPRHGLGVVPDA